MATIAKGSITLVNVNDAYSVLFTPDSCAIKADFDGMNPDLTNAYTDITVVRGEEKHTFKLTLASFSNSAITYQQTALDGYTKRIQLTSIPSDVLSGALTFTITTDDEFVADVTFTYSVIRETSMLDWILDWENNKTVIGDSYLITPKIFVGKKVENEAGLKTLTGVYIGPDDANTAGIYGYKEGEDVFHINANGAMIGGWNINDYGISASNEHGRLDISSNGSMAFYDLEGDVIWKIWPHGGAEFSQGNVHFYENGDAYFNGEIYAVTGAIGGWIIDKTMLYNDHIALDSVERIIGVSGASVFGVHNIKSAVQKFGGVYMFYDNANSYGLQGYLPRVNVSDGVDLTQSSFSLGSTNHIGNWGFDVDSLYMGTKVNVSKKYTAAAGDITIGSQGMRGKGWYIDRDGSVSFASGKVQFTDTTGSIVGWSLNERRLSNPNMALVSDTANAGIYMSVAEGTDFDNLASSSLTDYIDAHGGIYMKTKTDGVSFAAYDSSGRKIFKLRSNGVSSIAEWNIENDALYVGAKKVDAGAFTDEAGSVTFSSTGIRGHKWRLEADGSGALAGDMISWNTAGEIDFKAKVSADNITAGTISACTIQSSEENAAWILRQDGSGYLARGRIQWGTDGSLTINGEITASSGQIGNFQINSFGLYNGEISNWKADAIADVAALYPGSILLQKVYASNGQQIARVKVGIGEGADPTFSNGNFTYCPSVGYFYRKMNPTYESDFYLPAVKIVSDNAVNRDVALYTEGAIVCHGGMLSVGHFNNADKVTVLDFSFGTTMLIANTEYRHVYLPKLSVMKYTLNTKQPFVVPVRLVAQYNNSKNFIVKFQDGETFLYFRNYNGGEWQKEVSMGAGDVLSILLIWDGANYFAQLLDHHD